MPARPPNSRSIVLRGLAFSCVLTATVGAAQVSGDLPSAPALQRGGLSDVGNQALRLFMAPMAGSVHLELEVSGIDGASDEGAGDAGPTAPSPAQTLTMFPHSATARFWISGQANSIFQAHGHFHSPYQGSNSLIDDVEAKASEVATLYLGYQLWPNTRYNTDLIVDFENAGGRGISQALGLAGETNIDIVRNPTLSIAPYLSHGEIHQIIGLTDEMVDQERGPFALATKVPVRRFEIRIGKMSMPDTLDINSVGSDSHLQFTNWTIDNNGAWDYAADTRGYTVAGILEYDDRNWSARYAIAAMPTVANGIDLDWALSRANAQNWEFELRKGLFAPLLNSKRAGAVRVLSYVNHAHMGDYRESVQQYLAGRIATPDIIQSERNGQVKYGFGLNTEQEVTDSLRLFARFGWNDDRHESFVYTEVGQTILFGGDYNGRGWHRSNDKVGAAFVSNAIKRDHQNYLHYGGLGFLLGDGNLTYGREDIMEWYYNAHLWHGLYGMFGGTQIAHPGYNTVRGPIYVTTVRAHIDF
ncbi:MAG: carbohydrate porin [Terracidiphilus sp.]|nr:carbohydrate porin [Terracidiphilus sp.]